MHWFSIATVFIVLSLVSVEFSVAAFVDPAAWRLDPEPQLKILSHLAFVLGRVMPVWYPRECTPARCPDLAVLAHVGARSPAYS